MLTQQDVAVIEPEVVDSMLHTRHRLEEMQSPGFAQFKRSLNDGAVLVRAAGNRLRQRLGRPSPLAVSAALGVAAGIGAALLVPRTVRALQTRRVPAPTPARDPEPVGWGPEL